MSLFGIYNGYYSPFSSFYMPWLPMLPTFNFNFSTPSYSSLAFSAPTPTSREKEKPKTSSWNPLLYLTMPDKVRAEKIRPEPLADYDAKKGEQLAKAAKQGAQKRSTGWCARYVRLAMEKVKLTFGEVYQHAYQWVAGLRKNKNFKEIDVKGQDLKNLPPGAVIVYDRGDAGASAKSGHITIAKGDGTFVSDFNEKRVKVSDNAYVFIPVKA
jgi:hypothetical protein